MKPAPAITIDSETSVVQGVLNDRSVAVEEFSARLKGFVDEEFRLRRINWRA